MDRNKQWRLFLSFNLVAYDVSQRIIEIRKAVGI